MKTIKNVILLSLSFILLFSCNKEDQLSLKQNTLSIDSLVNAYDTDSEEKLISILNTWNLEYNSNEASVKQGGGITNDIYEIYKLIYKPFEINNLGDHEWNNINKDAKFIIIQNSINYDENYLIDEFADNDTDILKDFRPEIRFEDSKTLYLTDKYHDALLTFLNLGKEQGGNERTDPESFNRLDFLNKALSIYPGHWGGGYWHISTAPYVSRISFNTDKTKANVFFTVVYMGGLAEFEKVGGNWKMLSSQFTWIE